MLEQPRDADISAVDYRDCILNKSVFSFIRQLTTWHCPHLAAAVHRSAGRAVINRYLLASRPTVANPQQRRAAAGCRDRGTDGQTYGRTRDSCIDPATHTMRAVPAIITRGLPCRRHNVRWCRRKYCRDRSAVQRSASDYFQTTTL